MIQKATRRAEIKTRKAVELPENTIKILESVRLYLLGRIDVPPSIKGLELIKARTGGIMAILSGEDWRLLMEPMQRERMYRVAFAKAIHEIIDDAWSRYRKSKNADRFVEEISDLFGLVTPQDAAWTAPEAFEADREAEAALRDAKERKGRREE